MIDRLVRELHPLRSPASDDAIRAAERALGRTLPNDYKCFLRRTNGFEGSAADGRQYVQLAAVGDLPSRQQWVGKLDRPDVVWFGGDGGGEGYFFDLTTAGPTVLMINYISDWKTEARWHGDSFTDFLDRIVQGWNPWNGSGERYA